MMARKFLWILKAVNIAVFVFIFLVFSNIFNFRKIIWKPDGDLVITDVIYYLKNVLAYALFFCMYIIALGATFIVVGIFFAFPSFRASFMVNFVERFFRFYLAKWFSFPNGEAPSLRTIPELIVQELLKFLNNLYLFSFQIILIISIIFFVRSIIQTDPKYSLIAIGSLVLMIVLPLMVFGFRDMLALFKVSFEVLDELEDPVSIRLEVLPLDNLFLFLVSATALLAIVCYLYLEVSFQINYINSVTSPSLERSERLEAQLKIIRRESHFVVADIDKIKGEAKKRREEIEAEEEKLAKFFAQTSQRFSYVKEMIEKKKLEEEEKKLVSAASKTRRLGRYLERLFREDPESEETLTARSSAPQGKSLITSTFINFTFRLGLLVIISFIIIHPHWFFVNVFNLPPAITESLAMYSPEVVITLLIPFMLLFPVIAKGISYIKHRNLIIRLKQEGHIKEILASVGDYVKLDEELETAEEEIGEAGQPTAETAS